MISRFRSFACCCALITWVAVATEAYSQDRTRVVVPEGSSPAQAIDMFVAAGWQANGIAASPRCDDATFVRRIYLDLIGRIPTVEEASQFTSAENSGKRDALVNELLGSPEYARHMAELFDVMLLGRESTRSGRRGRGRFDRSDWRVYLTEAFAANRPWNHMARDMTLARDAEDTDVRGGWFLYERRDDHQAIAEAVGPAFFGIRVECAQCHDHPLASEILQSHYWGLVAFFNRGKNQDTEHGPRVTETALGGFQKYTDLAGDSFETQLTFFEGPIINEERPPEGTAESDDDYLPVSQGEPRVPKFSRRQQFVDRMLADHPLVASAFVNRMWALLMGRGIVHPFDRMDSAHEPSHPELLQWLSDDFRRSGYDVKRLVQAIVTTHAYQLDSVPADDKALPQHFAYSLDKPLDAESLLRSAYVVATGEPTEPAAELLREFSRNFPDVLPEESTTNVSSALMMTNHHAFNDLLSGEAATAIRELSAKTDRRETVRDAFRLIFGREPDEAELAHGSDYLATHANHEQAVRQLAWALVSSAEFRFNH